MLLLLFQESIHSHHHLVTNLTKSLILTAGEIVDDVIDCHPPAVCVY